MKRIIIILALLFIISHKNANCQEYESLEAMDSETWRLPVSIGIGYFNFSFSVEEINYQYNNHFSIGYEALAAIYFGTWRLPFLTGPNLKISPNNNVSLDLFCNFYPLYFGNEFIDFIFVKLCFLGLGVNVSYNFMQNIFVIGPQISLVLNAILFQIDFTCRYNYYIGKNTSYEFCFTFGIINFKTMPSV
jgi:hypothetical protein